MKFSKYQKRKPTKKSPHSKKYIEERRREMYKQLEIGNDEKNENLIKALDISINV